MCGCFVLFSFLYCCCLFFKFDFKGDLYVYVLQICRYVRSHIIRKIFSYMHHNVYSCFVFNELRYFYMNTTCDYSGETWNVLEQEMLGVHLGDNDFIKIFNIANLNIVTDINIKIFIRIIVFINYIQNKTCESRFF